MISLIVVNHHSATLARRAVETARAASSRPLQAIIVDNSLDAEESASLQGAADVVVVSKTNRGYGGGINDGRRASTGDVLLFANPDIVFAPRAIDHLVAALDGAHVAGPALFWDEAHEWLLPPADLPSLPSKIDEILAGRSRSWARERDRRRFRRRVAFWETRRPTPVPALSGAVLAIRAADFDEAGGFDERFHLYFEETDLLRRLSAMRKRIVYVPDARCRHLYNQSAGRDLESAAALYARSEMLYLEKWHGPLAARMLKRLERAPAVEPHPVFPGSIEVDPDRMVVEVSPLPSFTTAAGHLPVRPSVSLPSEVLSSVRSEELYVRVVERETAGIVGSWRVELPNAAISAER